MGNSWLFDQNRAAVKQSNSIEYYEVKLAGIINDYGSLSSFFKHQLPSIRESEQFLARQIFFTSFLVKTFSYRVLEMRFFSY